MLAISCFMGIVINMYHEPMGKHNIPHIHVEYQGDEAVFDFDGNAIQGSIPEKKKKLVIAWIEIHREDLEAEWKLISEGRGSFKIDPLR